MQDSPLIGLTSIVVLGIAAQWIAWRIRIPAIVLLLAFGLAVGPGLGWIDPDALLGRLLLPLVSLSVAVILLEGGLSLRIGELKQVGRVLIRLTTIGMLVTWILITAAARWLLELEWPVAAMLGAILVVTGPTVVSPLLRHLRLGGDVGSLLKWEGIVIDPLGVILAVCVFALVRARSIEEAAGHVFETLALTTLVGGALGVAGAAALIVPLRKFWIPDALQSVASLAVALGVFTAANVLAEEAGLLAVTVMGIVLANQRLVSVRHLVEFKENLTVLLVSSLFIVLSARLDREELTQLDWRSGVFLLVLILIVRPAAVLLSTVGSRLGHREKLFLSAIAPRGIVAAAVISVFALRLAEDGMAEASELVPVTFLVIIGTVTFSGLVASPLARALNLARPNPQGVLLVGAHAWPRALAAALVAEDVAVQLVDSDWANVARARQAGLPTYFGSILSEHTREEIDYTELGYLAAMTANEEMNSLACLRFIEVFGRGKVYQLPFDPAVTARREAVSLDQRGRLLFGSEATYTRLVERFGDDPALRATPLTKEFNYAAYSEMHGSDVLPLALVDEAGKVSLFTAINPPKPQPGQTIISALSLEAQAAAAAELAGTAGESG